MDLRLNRSITPQEVRMSPLRDARYNTVKSVDASRPSVGSSDSGSVNKLQASLLKKETLNQLQSLQNRIMRLAKEEHIARKKIQEAQMKAESIERNRQRHLEEIKHRTERKLVAEKEAQARKIKFAEIRQEHYDKVSRAMKDILKEKLLSVKERHEQKVQNNSMIVKMAKSFQAQKNSKKESVLIARNQVKQLRTLSQATQRKSTRDNYESRVEKERRAQEEALKKVISIQIRELEKVEASMLERLSMTQDKKQEVFKSLQEKAEVSKTPLSNNNIKNMF